MPEHWDDIEKAIRRVEFEKLMLKLEASERESEPMDVKRTIMYATDAYLEILGAVTIGVTVGVLTMLINFLVFIWMLHLELNFP